MTRLNFGHWQFFHTGCNGYIAMTLHQSLTCDNLGNLRNNPIVQSTVLTLLKDPQTYIILRDFLSFVTMESKNNDFLSFVTMNSMNNDYT
jgi:hypothetical protein